MRQLPLFGANLIVDGYSAGSIYNYFGVKISDPSSIILFIDGNGDRPPNIIGQDIYAAVFTSDGVVPAGNSMTNEDVNKKRNIKSSLQQSRTVILYPDSGYCATDTDSKIYNLLNLYI